MQVIRITIEFDSALNIPKEFQKDHLEDIFQFQNCLNCQTDLVNLVKYV